jgi:hypothetical protein
MRTIRVVGLGGLFGTLIEFITQRSKVGEYFLHAITQEIPPETVTSVLSGWSADWTPGIWA